MPRIGWGLLAPSPFCAKVELLLRMRGEPVELRPTLQAGAGPRKKLPWIEEGDERVADSEVITTWLEQRRGDVLGEAAVPVERRQVLHLARRTAEESLYFVLVAERWEVPSIYRAYTHDLLAGLPAPARPLVAQMARRTLRQQLWQQGTGRHPLAEALERGARDIEALAAVLGGREWFGGDAPVSADAAIWGSLANIWYTPVDGRLKRAVGQHATLVSWLDRVADRWCADVPLPTPPAWTREHP